jgi:hypothetical protein
MATEAVSRRRMVALGLGGGETCERYRAVLMLRGVSRVGCYGCSGGHPKAAGDSVATR